MNLGEAEKGCADPTWASQGRPEPAGAGQKAETDQIVRIEETCQSREGEFGAGNQYRLKGPWPSPVKLKEYDFPHSAEIITWPARIP